MVDSNYYKVGGSLEYQHPSYVVRQADHDLYEGLKNGEFCYVLNSRQMGKSSLRVQMMKRLKEEGVKCAAIDMTRIGSHVTPNEWYGGVVSELIRGFSLSRKVDFSKLWQERISLSPLQRLSDFIEDILLTEISENIVVFIDEIDSIIKMEFKCDFFAFIRGCYNRRADNLNYNRLTFCLLGVASPSDLIADKSFSTPFNIGRAIELTGFKIEDVAPLSNGLAKKTKNPTIILEAILSWTGGQPFLTQKICKLIATSEVDILPDQEIPFIEELIRSRIIHNWEIQDEPEHLRTIRDRVIYSPKQAQLLILYKEILTAGSMELREHLEIMELRLSGLVIREEGRLYSYNKIYQSVFNQEWVDNMLEKIFVSKDFSSLSDPYCSPDELKSEIGVNYDQLAKLLAEHRWTEADLETNELMLQTSNRMRYGWLRKEDIESFPYQDLTTIDYLWRKYSMDKFGFSTQGEIWRNLGGKSNSDPKTYYDFCREVGWVTESEDYLSYVNLNFNIVAPTGHLPGATLNWLWLSFNQYYSKEDFEYPLKSQPNWWEIINSIALIFERDKVQEETEYIRLSMKEMDMIPELKKMGFTKKEIAVQLLYSLKYSYRRIAKKLDMTPNELERHIKSINMKRSDYLIEVIKGLLL